VDGRVLNQPPSLLKIVGIRPWGQGWNTTENFTCARSLFSGKNGKSEVEPESNQRNSGPALGPVS